jgi:hypothetical protein
MAWVDSSTWIYDKSNIPVEKTAYEKYIEKVDNSGASTPIVEDTEALFRIKSYSGFKKTDIKTQWAKAILTNHIEQSMYWTAEMVVSGYYIELWDGIFLIMSKYIYTANPKLPYLTLKLYKEFKELIMTTDDTTWVGREIQLRNLSRMRVLFSQLIGVMTLSQKRHPVMEVKIGDSEFDMANMSSRLKSKSRGADILARVYRQGDDSMELYIPLLELTYSICYERNWLQANYWINWILEFEKYMIKKKDKAACRCHQRVDILPEGVHMKYANEWIWLLWELFEIIMANPDTNHILYKNYSATQAKKSILYRERIIASLKQLFSVRYSPNQRRNRRYILYFINGLLCEPLNTELELCGSMEIITAITDKINNVYKYIQKDAIGSYKPIEPKPSVVVVKKKDLKKQKEDEMREKLSYLFI